MMYKRSKYFNFYIYILFLNQNIVISCFMFYFLNKFTSNKILDNNFSIFNYIKSKSSPPSSSSSSSSSSCLRFLEAFGFGLLLPDDLAALLRPDAGGGGANTLPCALILTGPLSFKPPP